MCWSFTDVFNCVNCLLVMKSHLRHSYLQIIYLLRMKVEHLNDVWNFNVVCNMPIFPDLVIWTTIFTFPLYSSTDWLVSASCFFYQHSLLRILLVHLLFPYSPYFPGYLFLHVLSLFLVLGAVACSWKAPVSFVTSVCPL